MKDIPQPSQLELENLQQLSPEQLISIIVQQQRLIEQLQLEIERLKLQQQSNSQNSSKPPSTDLIQKSEKPKTKTEASSEEKRKPGGQPGHPGKTRKGFGRVDRYEVLRPQICPQCGGEEFLALPVAGQRFSGSQTGRATDRSG